ncbi:MAG: VWA domain-containing protein [Nitrospirales bacterium]|nr:VWA domain-containing protein [Nitrospirales bacterium]
MITDVLDFHFLRPWWLAGFLPLGAVIWLLIRQRAKSTGWEAACDAHLLPHLLVGSHRVQTRGPFILVALAWILALLALAGPVWSKLPQPVFRAQSALVVVLDLSRSMDAEDVKPSRLTRAKHKLLDILKRRQEGQTALVVYAGEPHVVSPLTDDANTISSMVSSLDTDLMPLQGSRSDLALRKALELLGQSHVPKGDILLITDGADESELQSVIEAIHGHHRISVLGVGSKDGAPIPQSGGFLKDRDGEIVIPKLDVTSLAHLARSAQGRYATLTVDDQDLETVLPSDWKVTDHQQDEDNQRTTDRWREEGPWLLFAILALTLPAFRQGWLGVVALMVLLSPSPGMAFFEGDWWFRPDQQGSQALEQDNPQTAATLFEDSAWKGVAHYRAGNFEQAIEDFTQDDSIDGQYNRGNALARAGQLQEALQAYQTVLKRDPHHEDAQFNHELISKLIQQHDQQNKSPGSQNEPSQDQQSSENGQSQSESQGEQSQQPDQRQTDQQQADQQQADASQAGEQSNGQSDQPQERSSQDTERQASQQSSEPFGSETQSEREHAEQLGESETDKSGEEMQQAEDVGDPSEQDVESEDQGSRMTAGLSREEKRDMESQQAMEQWLRRIPDDPGGLLRRKFLLEHRRRQEAGQLPYSGGQAW